MDCDGEREAERLAGDFEGWRPSLGEGDLEKRFPLLFSAGERLRDALPADFSLERLRDSRSDLTLDLLLERDFRVSERERDLLLTERLCDLPLRERDLS